MDAIESTEQLPLPEYQNLKDLQIEEVGEKSPGVLGIPVGVDAPLEEVYRKVREKTERQNWWFQDRWREKGLPHEQVIVESEHGGIEVFNWGPKLEQRHLDSLTKVIGIFANIRNGEALKRTQYILIDNNQTKNPLTGKVDDSNGYGAVYDKALTLYPRALKDIDCRVTGVPNFQGTVTHELTHGLTQEIENEWSKAFEWEWLDEPIILNPETRAHTIRQTRQPERCVDDYAKINPNEDICESMVAALWKPEALDPEKYQFLNKEMGIDEARKNQLAMKVERKFGTNIVLPHLENPVKFIRTGSIKIIWISDENDM